MKLGKRILGIALSLALVVTCCVFVGAGTTAADLNARAYSNDFDGTDPMSGMSNVSADNFTTVSDGHYLNASSKQTQLTNTYSSNFQLKFKLKLSSVGSESGSGLSITLRSGLILFLGRESHSLKVDSADAYSNENTGVEQDEWLDMDIRALNNTITVYVNGDVFDTFTGDDIGSHTTALPITFNASNCNYSLDDIDVYEIVYIDEMLNSYTIGSGYYNYTFEGTYNLSSAGANSWEGLAFDLRSHLYASATHSYQACNNGGHGYNGDTSYNGTYSAINTDMLIKVEVYDDTVNLYKDGVLTNSWNSDYIKYDDPTAATPVLMSTTPFKASWNGALATMENCTLYGSVYSCDFESGKTGVTTDADISDNKALHWDGLGGTASITGPFEDFILSAKIKITDSDPTACGSGGTVVMQFGVNDTDASHDDMAALTLTSGWVNYLQYHNTNDEWTASGESAVAKGSAIGTDWADIKIVRNGTTISVYVNNVLNIAYTDDTIGAIGSGSIKLTGWNCAYSMDNVTVYTQPCTVTAASKDETMGTVSGGGVFAKGASVTVTAVPKDGYSFSKWIVAGDASEIAVSTDASYTFVASDISLEAIFVSGSASDYNAGSKDTPTDFDGSKHYVINRLMHDYTLEFDLKVTDISEKGDGYDSDRGIGIEVLDGIYVQLKRGYVGMDGYDNPWNDYNKNAGFGDLIDEWAKVKIIVKGDTVTVYVNDSQVFTKSGDFIASGTASNIDFGTWDATCLLGNVAMAKISADASTSTTSSTISSTTESTTKNTTKTTKSTTSNKTTKTTGTQKTSDGVETGDNSGAALATIMVMAAVGSILICCKKKNDKNSNS